MKLFMIFLISLTSTLIANIQDTISYYKVYFNGKPLPTIDPRIGLRIKSDTLSANDSITVRYFTCIHCIDCKISLAVESAKHRPLAYRTNSGTGEPLSISLHDLIKSSYEELVFFYWQDDFTSRRDKVFLFTLRFD